MDADTPTEPAAGAGAALGASGASHAPVDLPQRHGYPLGTAFWIADDLARRRTDELISDRKSLVREGRYADALIIADELADRAARYGVTDLDGNTFAGAGTPHERTDPQRLYERAYAIAKSLAGGVPRSDRDAGLPRACPCCGFRFGRDAEQPPAAAGAAGPVGPGPRDPRRAGTAAGTGRRGSEILRRVSGGAAGAGGGS
jgi:hypothetical protein